MRQPAENETLELKRWQRQVFASAYATCFACYLCRHNMPMAKTSLADTYGWDAGRVGFRRGTTMRGPLSLALPVALMLVIRAAAADPASAAETTFADDFSSPVGDRWEAISGEWEVADGRLLHSSAEGAPHDRILAPFPLREGIIQVDAIPMQHNQYNFASVGLVGKYVDEDHQWWFRYGSYGRANIDGRIPRIDRIPLGSAQPELGRRYRLKLVIRGGLVGVSVNGIMIAIVEDPFADSAGRPGVFTETHAEFDNFKVTRFSP